MISAVSMAVILGCIDAVPPVAGVPLYIDIQPIPWHPERMLTSVAVPLLDGVAPFELGVLCEVFGTDRSEQGLPLMDFRVCGDRPVQARASGGGFTITPHHPLAAMADADLVAVPAAPVDGEFAPELLQQLRDALERGAWVMSVCSGAFALAAAGVLDGRRCTSHWMHTDELARRVPTAVVEPDVLFVEDGTVLTSAGSAAGIDAALHLVRREHGSAVAAGIARRMVVPPQRDGGQRQYVEVPVPACEADTLSPLLAWAVEHLVEDLSVQRLARRAGLSERTFARRFRGETGTTPHHWVTGQRVLLARRLLEDTDLPVEEVAERAGLSTAAALRHHFTPIVGTTPVGYRRTFRQTAV
jgi:transcriptional regulator GlxA family with amidase domain